MEPVSDGAVIPGGRDIDVCRIFLWKASKASCRRDQVPHWIDLAPRAGRSFCPIRSRRGEYQQRVAHLFVASLIPVRDLKPAAILLLHLHGILKRLDLI